MLLPSRFTYPATRILLAIVASTASVTVLAQEPADFTIPRAQPAPVTDIPDSHSSTVLPAIAEPEAPGTTPAVAVCRAVARTTETER